jgi:pyridinium-3,5-bisthiocarboxylic acid mononucleotide nickel chelatase
MPHDDPGHGPADRDPPRDDPGPWQAPPPLAHGAGVGRVLHIDAFAGVAGDMLVAALLDLGVPPSAVTDALDALPVQGYSLALAHRTEHGVVATRFLVDVTDPQPHRTYKDIRAMLTEAPLAPGVRDRALATFAVLARAEARVHRMDPEEVHFHEVGAVDAIVDVVSACAGLDWLGARVNAGPLPMSSGFVRAEHGVLPVPAPAVLEVLAGVPTVGAALQGEMVTPTGASLVRANATSFEPWPAMSPVVTGFGCGTRRWPDRPNLLRLVLGEPTAARAEAPEATHFEVRCNLDDLSAEMVAVLTERLLREGALDAWTAPIGMKKGRPGVTVTALVRAADRERVTAVMLSESGSLGVRWSPVARVERPRETITVDTVYGAVPVKVARGDGLAPQAHPELEPCRALAAQHGVPARVVAAAALSAWWAQAQ